MSATRGNRGELERGTSVDKIHRRGEAPKTGAPARVGLRRVRVRIAFVEQTAMTGRNPVRS
jgi:hypothetical protein